MRLTTPRRAGATLGRSTAVAVAVGVLSIGGTASATTPDDAPSPEPVGVPDDTLTGTDDDQPPAPDESTPSTAPTETSPPPDDGGDGGGSGDEEPDVVRPDASPSIRSSNIPVGSIAIALVVLAVVGTASVAILRRRPHDARSGQRSVASRTDALLTDAALADTSRTARDLPATLSADQNETLEFLIELGEALLDAGDSVGHVESTVQHVAELNGIEGLGVLALPSSIVLSVHVGESVATEVRTTTAGALRLDQIDDVLHIVNKAERGDITAAEGRVALARIRTAPPAATPRVLLAAHVVSTVGLAMVLRGGWVEVMLAAVLGAVIGCLRLVTISQRRSYQAFWPLVAASVSSATVFATAHVLDDLTVFPALVSPLITFLPGGLLTIAILELATGQTVSGASRLAAGALQLVLLALGIVAGAQLVGVPGGDIRGGGDGAAAALVPWVGVGLFGLGIAWFNGARRTAHRWILLVLYVAYAGQVLGGLFFGTSLSAFFGAVAMTPTAVLASRQRSGPTPLVTFLPGFWILVPGALGLEGVTRIIGEGASGGTGALITTLTSMIGISFGLLLGLVLAGADPERPWSVTRSRY